MGKLGGRRDAPVFSRIDLQLIQVHGNYEASLKSDVIARSSSDIDYDSDNSSSSKLFKKTNTIVFQSPRESFLIFARYLFVINVSTLHYDDSTHFFVSFLVCFLFSFFVLLSQ